jgi:hypothetical protein
MPRQEALPATLQDRSTLDVKSRLHPVSHGGDDEEKQRLSLDLDTVSNHEDDELLPKEKHGEQPGPKSSFISGLIWMVINTLATIGIASNTPF